MLSCKQLRYYNFVIIVIPAFSVKSRLAICKCWRKLEQLGKTMVQQSITINSVHASIVPRTPFVVKHQEFPMLGKTASRHGLP